MKISFLKISDKEHELRIVRRDGSSDFSLCETRSFLVHDLTHLAFELEAKIQNGFWGLVAQGKTLSELSDRSMIADLSNEAEIMVIEKTVAILQSLIKGRTPGNIVEEFWRQGSNFDWARSEWFELDFVTRVDQRLQGLFGRWKATKYGETMDIVWEDSQQDL